MSDKTENDARGAGAAVRRRGIDRVVLLLDTLLREGRPMTAGELARLLDAPRSTTYEIVDSLSDAGLLEKAAGGCVSFGPTMHLYGRAYAAENAQARRTAAVMDELGRRSGETVQLCGLRGNKYIILDSRDATGPFRITSRVGATVPIPWTASGRLLLAHLSREEIERLVPADDYLLPDGRRLSPDGFISEIEAAEREGYSETSGLADRFTLCMAAPVRDAMARTIRTLCLVMPTTTPAERRDELRTLLRELAGKLSLHAD